MEIKVTSKYLRISPRKLRPTVNLVRGKVANDALLKLKFQNGKAPVFVYNLLHSAIAIAKSTEIDDKNFKISQIVCNEGPRLKRGVPASKGSYMPIVKKQSHLVIVLSDQILDKTAKKTEKAKIEKKEIEKSAKTEAKSVKAPIKKKDA